jgi:hypothetical protein
MFHTRHVVLRYGIKNVADEEVVIGMPLRKEGYLAPYSIFL